MGKNQQKTVHWILQGKGGVGKSFIATLLSQFLKEKNNSFPTCIDTDPVNASLFQFKQFETIRLDVMDGDDINPRRFDEIIELINQTEKDVIVDNGASSFIALSSFLLSNQIFELLKELNFNVLIHTVIVGDQSLRHTMNYFAQMIQQFENVNFVIWLNRYFGEISHEGKTFEQFKIYQDNKEKILGIVNIPVFKEATHGHDLAEILKANELLDEGINNPKYSIVMRQRLKIVKKDIFSAMHNAGL